MVLAAAIVFACLSAGHLVVWLTGMPLPPAIIGLLLLFGFLQLRWVTPEQVRPMSDVLLQHLMLMLIPACVAVMDYLEVLGKDFTAIALSSIASTLLVLWVSAAVHAWARRF